MGTVQRLSARRWRAIDTIRAFADRHERALDAAIAAAICGPAFYVMIFVL